MARCCCWKWLRSMRDEALRVTACSTSRMPSTEAGAPEMRASSRSNAEGPSRRGPRSWAALGVESPSPSRRGGSRRGPSSARASRGRRARSGPASSLGRLAHLLDRRELALAASTLGSGPEASDSALLPPCGSPWSRWPRGRAGSSLAAGDALGVDDAGAVRGCARAPWGCPPCNRASKAAPRAAAPCGRAAASPPAWPRSSPCPGPRCRRAPCRAPRGSPWTTWPPPA